MIWLSEQSTDMADPSMGHTMSQKAVNRLFTLAHDDSQEGRAFLVAELVKLFDRADVDLSMREQSIVNDIVDELVDSAELTLRCQLSEQLAPLNALPRRVALTLAGDCIEVADPVLRLSPVLTDADLVSLVVSMGTDHARAVALRTQIGEAVVDALVITGDVTTMERVAENLGAKISPRALTILVNAARFAETLCKPLLNRSDLTADRAAQLYWWIAPALRRVALERFGVGIAQSKQAQEQTIADLLNRYVLERNQDDVMAHVADWLMERDFKDAKILNQILRAGHYRLFSIMLSRLINMPLPLTDRIIIEMGGRSLAVACRALLLDKPQFVSLFLLSRGARPGEQIVQPRELNNAIVAFDRVTPAIATQLLSEWRHDPSYLLQRSSG